MGWILVTIAVLAVIAFAAWRAAFAFGSADTLNRLDGFYSRGQGATQVAAVQYGDNAQQRIELYVPETASGSDTGHPVVIFVHGGSWNFGEPEEYTFIARTLGDLGYATALVGYRLVPDGEFPAMLEDSAASVRWVVDNAAKHGVNADAITLMGHSAGAYNVLMTGLDRQWLGRAGLPDDTIKGVISLAGPADFLPLDSDSTKAAFGHVDPLESTQPIGFARGDGPPLLLLHGSMDTTVYPRNSVNLDKAMREAGGVSEVVEYPEMNHAQIIMAYARPFEGDRKVIDKTAEFLASVTQPSSATEPPSAPVQAAAP
ncbi:alpha/beta hydrolase [Altererythrobacter sp. ZODW24]|uniref:alpha/beta hydrolase n=1 Tax=Altererythrobacter sp. ZODW24 TaxID=2185142 RepID=UPI001F088509|nr:alpha/beta hydrolase [Altererythrobacter sp. ZODW24]